MKGDHPFKSSITEEVPLLVSREFCQFLERKLIVTRRKKVYEKNDDIIEKEFDLGVAYIAQMT